MIKKKLSDIPRVLYGKIDLANILFLKSSSGSKLSSLQIFLDKKNVSREKSFELIEKSLMWY